MSRLLLTLLFASVSRLGAQDPREIVRKSVQMDQANWLRMKDYTWVARLTERHLDSNGQVKAENKQAWETVILYGEPHRRMLERHSQPLPPDEQRKEQQKLDKALAKLEHETPGERQRRLANL